MVLGPNKECHLFLGSKSGGQRGLRWKDPYLALSPIPLLPFNLYTMQLQWSFTAREWGVITLWWSWKQFHLPPSHSPLRLFCKVNMGKYGEVSCVAIYQPLSWTKINKAKAQQSPSLNWPVAVEAFEDGSIVTSMGLRGRALGLTRIVGDEHLFISF